MEIDTREVDGQTERAPRGSMYLMLAIAAIIMLMGYTHFSARVQDVNVANPYQYLSPAAGGTPGAQPNPAAPPAATTATTNALAPVVVQTR